jgi:hypothetical protein
MNAFAENAEILFIFVAFSAILALGLAILFLPSKGDASLFDVYVTLPRRYGVLWIITNPEAYFKKKYVKCVHVIVYVFLAALGGFAVSAYVASLHR